MATYFNGTAEIEGDGMQTLYIMNPSLYAGYSDAPAQANMAFINPMNLSANGQQHFAGIPLQATDSAARPPPIQMATATHDDLSAVHQGLSPRLHYNLWIPVPSSNSVIARAPRQGLLPLGLSAGGDEAKIVESSKYLKAAQQLLDEVVNVGHGGKAERTDSPMKLDEGAGAAGGEGNSGAKRGVHLATGERQELQMTKAKLANMLDEVEQRYGQYRHQMQIIASSFEAVAGLGSAGTYTALALQTMSKQFQCLRDAISGQMRATSDSGEGEEECLGGRNKSAGSRLRYVDHHLRQQRALQQLGMAQYNTWRPQRGLPEHAVSVLRAWLFDHFLHPYPKDSDKHMLAKETGLTRSQVSNWFINARVRLWKPMVEEMYMEETKEQGHNAGRDDQKSSKSEGREHSVSRSASNHHGQSPTRTDQANGFKGNQDDRPAMTIQPSNLGVFDEEPFVQQRMTKARSGSVLNPMSRHEVEQQDDVSNREVVMEFMDHHGAYHEEYAPRVGGNGVSLTLGLPHCESPPLSGSRRATYLSSHSIPLGRRLDINGVGSEEINYFSLSSNSGNNNPSSSHPPNVMYESIDNQNRKRIAAQLIPDYVA